MKSFRHLMHGFDLKFKFFAVTEPSQRFISMGLPADLGQGLFLDVLESVL
jgi:hypothetical protein